MLASAADQRENLTPGSSYTPPPAFGPLKVLHQIGAGVLGPVFRAREADGGRLLAVKAFSLDLTPEQAAQLAAQLKRLAGLELRHACIPAPVAAGVEDSVPYLAVPYVAGESLDAAIRQYGPAPASDAIRLVTHVADALDAAADAGVFHGSLHPRDVLVTPGETHVTGLGVAQALERVGLHGPIRRPYVAPERESGDEWGACADIYSLGAIAYEVLTGRRVLPGADYALPGLTEVRVQNPVALREAIEFAMDPEPGRRPSRAREFAEAFAKALSESIGSGDLRVRQDGSRQRRARSRPPKLPGLDEPLDPALAPPTGEERAAPAKKPLPPPAGRRITPAATLRSTIHAGSSPPASPGTSARTDAPPEPVEPVDGRAVAVAEEASAPTGQAARSAADESVASAECVAEPVAAGASA
ncbi:MAG TPA: protein kinase, partial [Vicinamibacterales bacterium]|nr:protein kinase [Vicinamibacterales bacterium]